MNVNVSVHGGSVGGYETPLNVVCHFLPIMVEENALEDLMVRGFSILPARTCWVFGQAYFEKMVLEFCVTHLYADGNQFVLTLKMCPFRPSLIPHAQAMRYRENFPIHHPINVLTLRCGIINIVS
jgi:hypothetical protein